MTAIDLATWLLVAFAIVAAVDGIYFHLWKYRLFERPESRVEHLLHTVRALFFAPLILLLYAYSTSGPLLWLTVVMVVADFFVEAADVWIERDSRGSLGGLTSAEYLLHILAGSLRVGSFTLILGARPSEAWLLESPHFLGEGVSHFSREIAFALLPGSVLLSVVHIALSWHSAALDRLCSNFCLGQSLASKIGALAKCPEMPGGRTRDREGTQMNVQSGTIGFWRIWPRVSCSFSFRN